MHTLLPPRRAPSPPVEALVKPTHTGKHPPLPPREAPSSPAEAVVKPPHTGMKRKHAGVHAVRKPRSHHLDQHGSLCTTQESDKMKLPNHVALPLQLAIDAGDWELTEFAMMSLCNHLDKNPDTRAKKDYILENGLLVDKSSIYEYACRKGQLGLTLEFARWNDIWPVIPRDPLKLDECTRQLTYALETAANKDTMGSMAQLMCTYQEVQLSREKHTLAAQYYQVRHQYLLFLPATLFTAVSAVLSFLSSTADLEGQRTLIVLIAAIIATASTLLQTISDQLGLNGRAVMHRTAASELDNVLLSLNLNAVDAIKSGASAFRESDLNVVRKQVVSIEASCADSIPMFLDAVYDPVIEEFAMYTEVAGKESDPEEMESNLAMLKIRLIVFITSEIMNVSSWPWSLSAKTVATRVRRKMTSIFEAAEEYLEEDDIEAPNSMITMCRRMCCIDKTTTDSTKNREGTRNHDTDIDIAFHAMQKYIAGQTSYN